MMQLQSICGTFAYHFQVTPAGWNLVCMARNKFYEPRDAMTFEACLARKLKQDGRDHYQPTFSIDYVRGVVVNVTWDASLIANTLAAATITTHLREIEREYDLALLHLVGDLQCENFLNGFCGNPSIRRDLQSSS